MFGGALAVQEDQRAMRLAALAEANNAKALPNYLVVKLAHLYLKKQDSKHNIDLSIPRGYFDDVDRQYLFASKMVWTNDFKEVRLTVEAMALMKAAGPLVQGLVPPFHLPVSPTDNTNTLQCFVRNTRSVLQVITRRPFFLERIWWHHIMWEIRRWWQTTRPETKPYIDMEVLARPLWSKADDDHNTQMWLESHLKAFWLCSAGVETGLKTLNTLDRLKNKHGKKFADAVFAVSEIAQLCEQLPPLQPKQDLRVDNCKATYTGLSYDIKSTGTPSKFIVFAHNHVESLPSSTEVASEEATKAVKALGTKTRLRKPKQIVLIDEFNQVFNGLG